MTTLIQPRAAWTSTPAGGTYVAPATRRGFSVHYHGDYHCPDRLTPAIIRGIDSYHRKRGWLGIGYNLIAGQDGSAYEARGWDKMGAHAGPGNRPDYGVQAHIGGDQRPTDALLRTLRDLYEIACQRSGRRLAMRGHSYWMNTSCPGEPLLAWVKAGMPYPSTRKVIDMQPTDPTHLKDRDGTPVTVGEALPRGAWAYARLEEAGLLTPGKLAALVRDIAALKKAAGR